MVFLLFLVGFVLALWGYSVFLDSILESTGFSWVLIFGWVMFPVCVLMVIRTCAAFLPIWGWLQGLWKPARADPNAIRDAALAYKFPSRIIERLQNMYPALSLKDCELVVDGLRQFFSAALKNGREGNAGECFAMPSKVADALWRELILHTREYEYFCRSAGFYMDRVLTQASTDRQKIRDGLQRCWLHVCAVESLDGRKPMREPLLFNLDTRLNIVKGYRYLADRGMLQGNEDGAAASVDRVYQLERNSSIVTGGDKKSPSSRERAIRTYIFPVDAIEKLKARYPFLTSDDYEQVVSALRNFFLINLKSDGAVVSMPSVAADALWQEFILHTKSYRLFCDSALGRFVHHMPMGACEELQREIAGIELCWTYACREEGIDPGDPARLPLLFALDDRLKIPDGFSYKLDCSEPRKQSVDGKIIYCIKDFTKAGNTTGGLGNPGLGPRRAI